MLVKNEITLPIDLGKTVKIGVLKSLLMRNGFPGYLFESWLMIIDKTSRTKDGLKIHYRLHRSVNKDDVRNYFQAFIDRIR